MTNFKLAIVDPNYCDFLRKFDSKVPFNKELKENRPFVGVLFNVNRSIYFAPLSSPKPKHLHMKNSIDFLKIDGGKLGAINMNNMIPLVKNTYEIINFKIFNEDNDIKYGILLNKQLYWLNSHSIQVRNKAINLYNLRISNRLNENIKKRCCDFIILEAKSLEYKN